MTPMSSCSCRSGGEPRPAGCLLAVCNRPRPASCSGGPEPEPRAPSERTSGSSAVCQGSSVATMATARHVMPLRSPTPRRTRRPSRACLLEGCRLAGENWDVLWLANLRKGSPWLAVGSGQVEVEADLGAPVIETTMPSGRHWASESGHLKYTVSSGQRRLEREGRHGLILEAKTPGHVAVALGN